MSYIGKQPGFGIRNRYYYTATAAQTTFSGADDNGQTLAYADSKYLDVFLNGVLLVAGTDYTATTLTSVTLSSGAAASDIIEIVAYDIFSVADTVSSASGGTFNGAVTFDAGLNTDTISEATSGSGVTIDGVLLKDNDIEATDATFSGGVYLGGTAAANYFDDYEEGTWTPDVSGATWASTPWLVQGGSYTKKGRTVTCEFVLFAKTATFPSLSSDGNLTFTGLPFTHNSNYSDARVWIPIHSIQRLGNDREDQKIAIELGAATSGTIRVINTGSLYQSILQGSEILSDGRLSGTFSYFTDS
jgi:hypothetical protein